MCTTEYFSSYLILTNEKWDNECECIRKAPIEKNIKGKEELPCDSSVKLRSPTFSS